MPLLKFSFNIVLCLLLTSCARPGVNFKHTAEGDSFPADKFVSSAYTPNNDGILRVLTLNIAHGRNQAANQLLLDKQHIENNLKAITQLLEKTNADVVALQEADGPSRWSGKFDHVTYLAREAGYPWHYRANHAESWLFSYGTAILSRLPVAETIQHTFEPSPPTLNKGFLLNRVRWTRNHENNRVINIDVVSVHLDFSRQGVRDAQIAEMSTVLADRKGPMIILGDFNSEWFSDESVVKKLAENGGMSVYRHDAKDMPTYNSRYRYDWILVSDELVFVDYTVLPDAVSDHAAVVAEIRLEADMDGLAEQGAVIKKEGSVQ
ncbi:MAG: endonuclease/exonuclease/phosphatase family protein [Gammaproteobacteria bacterium]|nr:endonuclease/exonuclease/phosphatase family protein [Gammaproteobacteria bacterium]